MKRRNDYVLRNANGAYYPGLLNYRSDASRVGYATADQAHDRAVLVMTHYAAKHGLQGPDLRVVAR